MRSFFETVRISFRSDTVFRLNMFFAMVGSFISIAIQLLIWNALYASSASGVVAGKSLSDMVTYVLITSICSILTSTSFATNVIETKMKTGQIAHDLLRPQSPRLTFIATSFGSSMSELVVNILPLMLLGVLFFNQIKAPVSLLQFSLFLVSILLGFVITMLLEIIKGCFAFWFVQVLFLNWSIQIFTIFLSGSLVPLWFFPGWLQTVARLLPFQAISFLPVEIYLGQRDTMESLFALGIQLGWIGLLFLLQQFLWKKSINQLVVLGG